MILTFITHIVNKLEKKGILSEVSEKDTKHFLEIVFLTLFKNEHNIFLLSIFLYAVLLHLCRNNPILNYIFLLMFVDIYYYINNKYNLKNKLTLNKKANTEKENDKLKELVQNIYKYMKNRNSILENLNVSNIESTVNNSEEINQNYIEKDLNLSDTLIHTLNNINKYN